MPKQLFWIICGLLLTLAGEATAQLPPYLPPPQNLPRQELVEESQIPNGPATWGKAGRQTRSLNGIWKCSGLTTSVNPFSEDADQKHSFAAVNFDDTSWDNIAVPLNWYKKYPQKQNPGEPYVKGWYRTSFSLTAEERTARRVMLKFDVVGYDALVFLNGKIVGCHRGDFTPFELDVTAAAQTGRNVLAVRILSDQGPNGGIKTLPVHAYGSLWSLNNIRGGIWQNVTLALEPEIRLEQILITPRLATNSVEADYRLINHTGKPIDVRLIAQVVPAAKKEAADITGETVTTIKITPGLNCGTISIPLKKPVCWTPETPYLYFLKLRVDESGKMLSGKAVRFGYRDFVARDGNFYLNDKKIYLFGQNLSSILYGGNGRTGAEEKERLETEIRKLRNSGAVIVRTAHMPILPLMLELADEYGLMVYNEWAWSFVAKYDFKAFEKNNLAEIKEFVEASYNHPSVVMWSMGNEIPHRNMQATTPDVVKQLNLQVGLVHQLDKSGRPVSTFSGAGGWSSYGETKLDTDVHDMHNYTGLYDPWTLMPDVFARQYQGELRIYQEQKRLSRPLIAWENVGFSWGAYVDPKFQRGNVKQYAAYVNKPTSWSHPNGVGFTGVAPLFKALAPEFGPWAQTIYGHRIFEQFRLNANCAGFAPWFATIPASTLWNQPVYPSLYSNNYLFPRNLFLGEKSSWNMQIVNDGNQSYRDLILRFTLFERQDKEISLGEVSIGNLAEHQRFKSQYELAIPASLAAGNYQLRLTLFDSRKQEVARNFYDVFLQQRDILRQPIKTTGPVYLFNTGVAQNVNATAAVLRDFGLNFTVISNWSELKQPGLAIVPAENPLPQKIDLSNNPSLYDFIRVRGGTLLVLEQQNQLSKFPGNLSLMPHSATFVDLVSPEHPLFKGLEYWNFDTWSSENHGFIIHNSLIPYTVNALAVKGPTFSRTNLGSAIVEATDGKGRIIMSQLDVMNTQNRDSVAASYLHNLIDYAAGNGEFKTALPLAENLSDYEVNPQQLTPIDLAPYANRSFSDENDNDGIGGWTDQGKNDFRTMPLGRQTIAGIPFTIIDPKSNGNKSCLILRGSERPNFPAAIRNIKINGQFSRLFFHHTAGWGGSGLAGVYRINYADGTTTDYEIKSGENVGDWWHVAALPGAKVGVRCKNPVDHEVGTYVSEWNNPRPTVPIKSLDFISAGAIDSGKIDWLPTGTPIPILIALTGEKTNQSLADLTGARFRSATNAKENGSVLEGRVTCSGNQNDRELAIKFPACSGKNVPAVRVAFDPSGLAGEYTFLSFWAQSEENGTIQLVLAEKNWKGTYSGEIRLRGDGRRHKYRLRFNQTLNRWGQIDLTSLRGELFIFYRSKHAPNINLPELLFKVKNIMLE